VHAEHQSARKSIWKQVTAKALTKANNRFVGVDAGNTGAFALAA
jgi:hypothetical protein